MNELNNVSIIGNQYFEHDLLNEPCLYTVSIETREGFLRKNIVAVSFFQNCAIHQYSLYMYISFPLNEIIQA